MKKLSKDRTTKLCYSFLVLEKVGSDKTRNEKGKNYVDINATDIFKAAKLAKNIGCDYFEVKPSFDPFHFLNETSNLMANIIKDELKKCEPLQDDKFSANLNCALERTIEGEKMQEKFIKHAKQLK